MKERNTNMQDQKMFCYQCQETARCQGCTVRGVCGKTADVANMQDLLIYSTKGLSAITTAVRKQGGEVPKAINHFVTVSLFMTITNANFDLDAIEERVAQTEAYKAEWLQKVDNPEDLPAAATESISRDQFAEKAKTVGVLATENEDIRSLRELITYGLKGLSAYTKHANALLKDDEDALTQVCRHYIQHCQCPRMMNQEKVYGRKKYVADLAKEYGADGIIYEQVKFCDPWAYERMLGSAMLQADYHYPVLSVDRPYNVAASVGQMRTRVQAFVESVEIKKIQRGGKA